jgi:hypothetical protein
MHLTSEQQEQIQQSKASGAQRIHLELTPAQKRDWQAAADAEVAGKPDNLAHLRKIKAAAASPGFFGDIRRAMLLSRRPISELAAAIAVDTQVLSDFRAAEAELPASALDRLLSELGLRVMQEIPR